MVEYIYKILIIHQTQATSLSINNSRRHKSFEGTEDRSTRKLAELIDGKRES